MVNAASLNTAKGDILIGLQSKLDFADSSWKGRPLIAFGDVGLLYQDDEKGIFALSQPSVYLHNPTFATLLLPC